MATLSVEKREGAGKYVAFNMRKEGFIPGVIYGRELAENINIKVPLKEFMQVVHAGERVIDLDVAGEKKHAMIQDVQHGTFAHEILHADFRAVSDKDSIRVVVPLELVGDAAGAATGGHVEQSYYEVEIDCTVGNLPEKIELDISGLELDQVLFVKDLPKLDGVKIRTTGDIPVVSCHMPAAEVEPAEGEEAESDGAEAPAAE